MAVSIRLRREGTKNRAYYKVVVAERWGRRDGKFLEQVGIYDPVDKKKGFTLQLDRIEHWIKNGAQPSDTVSQMIKKARKVALSTAAAAA